ncbi:MAG TPA: hypothetical protein VF692_06340 [Pyrinomonadaceae bacterium]|jgi:hypothetical protein
MKRKTENFFEQSEQPKLIVLHSGDGGDSHEPPIGVGGDPPYIDPPHDLPPEPPPPLDEGLKEGAVRYYKYKFARKAGEMPYFNLESVRVLTEKGDASGKVSFVEYGVPRDRISKLRLWLGDNTGEPDIIIEGANGGRISTTQPFEERQTANPPKRNRNKRYYFPDRDTRIVKWDIVDDSGAVLSDLSAENGMLAAETDDQYHFYISFAHE